MKKLIAVLMAMLLCSVLFACGGSAASVAEEPAAVEETAVVDSEETAGALDEETMEALKTVCTVNYLGLTGAEEPVVLCCNDDISFAILGIVDTESGKSFSMVGNVTENEDGTLTITDETSQLNLTFSVVQNDDDTITLDMGDLGTCTIVACEQEEALDVLQTIATYTESVA